MAKQARQTGDKLALGYIRNQPHLRDLFRVGQEVPISIDADPENDIKIYMRVPSPDQQQEAIRRAGAKQARVKSSHKDKDGDDYQTLMSSVEEFETKDELVEFLLKLADSELQEEAYNDILYNDDYGSNWTESTNERGMEGRDYLNTLQAMFDRRNEVQAMGGKLEEDEEYTRLDATFRAFQDEVTERHGALRQAKALKFQNEGEDELRAKVAKDMIDVIAKTSWLQEYNDWMIFFACRYPDRPNVLYFNSPLEIDDLPPSVQKQIHEGFAEVNQAGTDLKDLPTPGSSSPSSEPSEE